MRQFNRWTAGGLLLALLMGTGPEIPWYTLDGGGALHAAGGNFTLSGTIGQPDAGRMSGGSRALVGGFWGLGGCLGSVKPDFDQDCDVDFADLMVLDDCATGAGGGPVSGQCLGKDLDGDGDVDSVEFALWQRCYTGDNGLALPTCDD